MESTTAFLSALAAHLPGRHGMKVFLKKGAKIETCLFSFSARGSLLSLSLIKVSWLIL
jgi:hypothetical protein